MEETIKAMLDDPDNGVWNDIDGQKVYTPNPSFFADKVSPFDLLTYFIANHADDDKHLNLP